MAWRDGMQLDDSACGVFADMGLLHYFRTHQIPTADDFGQHDVPAARLFIAHQLTLTAEQSSNVVVTFASAASRQRQVATTKITHSPYFED